MAVRATGREHRAARVVQWSAGLSALGDGTFRSASPLLAAALNPDPRAVALVAMGTSAGWLTGPWCGAITDRIPRRRVLFWANAVRGIAFGVLAVLLALGYGSILVLTVTAFLVTTGNVLAEAAAQAVLPSLVGTGVAELGRQTGRLAMSETVGRFLFGLPLGSAAFAVGRVAPVTVNLLAFVGSSVFAAAVPREPPVPKRKRRLHADVADGLAHLFRTRSLLAMSGLVAAFNFADALAMSVFVLYAAQRLGVTDFGYGMLLMVLAVGAVAGGWLGGRIVTRVSWPSVQLVVFVIQAGAWTLVACTGSVWLTASALAVMGAGSTVGTVSVVLARQTTVPNHLLGRVIAGFRVFGNGAGLLGAFLGGFLAAKLGVATMPWFSVGVLAAVALPLACGIWATGISNRSKAQVPRIPSRR